jgi:hypothetical protein
MGNIVQIINQTVCLNPWLQTHHLKVLLRRTAVQREIPQVPVPHEAAELALREKDPPPVTRDAKVEIFLFTCELPHFGQVTSLIALLLRTSSSKDRLQSAHTNSNRGIKHS